MVVTFIKVFKNRCCHFIKNRVNSILMEIHYYTVFLFKYMFYLDKYDNCPGKKTIFPNL